MSETRRSWCMSPRVGASYCTHIPSVNKLEWSCSYNTCERFVILCLDTNYLVGINHDLWVTRAPWAWWLLANSWFQDWRKKCPCRTPAPAQHHDGQMPHWFDIASANEGRNHVVYPLRGSNALLSLAHEARSSHLVMFKYLRVGLEWVTCPRHCLATCLWDLFGRRCKSFV